MYGLFLLKSIIHLFENIKIEIYTSDKIDLYDFFNLIKLNCTQKVDRKLLIEV